MTNAAGDCGTNKMPVADTMTNTSDMIRTDLYLPSLSAAKPAIGGPRMFVNGSNVYIKAVSSTLRPSCRI